MFLDLPEMAAKQLELLKEIVPSLSRVVVLWDVSIGEAQFRAVEAAARAAKLVLHSAPTRRPEDLEASVRDAGQNRSGGLVILSAPLIIVNQKRIVDAVLKQRLPATSLFPSFPKAGLLMAYGPNLEEMFRRCGEYVASILNGRRPSDLPVERPAKFELVINAKTAKALGLTIPQSLLLRADQVIQ